MASTIGSVSVEPGYAGLDRTRIDASGKIELVSLDSNSANSDSTLVPDEALSTSADTSPRNGDGLMSKRHRLLNKTKELLHVAHQKVVATAPVLANARDTISDSRLVIESPKPKQHTMKDILHHPVSTAISKATGSGGHQVASNLVAKEISHGNEVEIVRAHDEAEKPGTDVQVEERQNALEMLLKERQDMFVRWTMDRHVTKVRILPVETVPKRSRDDFEAVEENGKRKTDWESWARHSARYYAERYGSRHIGYCSSPPTASKETLMPAIEKVLVATAPLQTLVMSVRRVYRWENRNETLKYLIMYSVLWIFNLIAPGFLAATIYFTINRRIRAPRIEDLRVDIKRVEDLTETALTLSEFIEKKGDQSWLDPLIEEVGPWAMIQLADVANLMETLRNFYEWRVPSQTAQILGLMSVGLLAATFVPIQIVVRLCTLCGGIAFFGLFPIGSRFPEYRLLVSPVKWVLWNIPTHAEWSIATLQAEGQRHRNKASSSQTNATPALEASDLIRDRGPLEESDDYGSYSCSHDGMNGKLILNVHGVYFISSIGHKKHFDLPYESIDKVEKVMRVVSKGISKVLNGNTGEDLQITAPGGSEYLLKSMKDRDQAFSQIVGFSQVRWQVVW